MHASVEGKERKPLATKPMRGKGRREKACNYTMGPHQVGLASFHSLQGVIELALRLIGIIFEVKS